MNDLKLDFNDQHCFIFEKKQRVQEVFLFTNYKETYQEDKKGPKKGCQEGTAENEKRI